MGTTATTSPVSTSAAEADAPVRDADDAGADAGARSDARVNAADSYSRGALRWGYFLLLNAIAGAIAVAFFVSVLYADGLDPYLLGTYQWLLDHPGVTSVLAFSPLACSLLVGYGYASRARKRKQLAAQREAQLAAARREAQQDTGEAEPSAAKA